MMLGINHAYHSKYIVVKMCTSTSTAGLLLVPVTEEALGTGQVPTLLILILLAPPLLLPMDCVEAEGIET